MDCMTGLVSVVCNKNPIEITQKYIKITPLYCDYKKIPRHFTTGVVSSVCHKNPNEITPNEITPIYYDDEEIPEIFWDWCRAMHKCVKNYVYIYVIYARVLMYLIFYVSVLQCVAVCYSVLQCVAKKCNQQYSVLQCVAECCSVLQCVAVCCEEM